MKVFSTVWTTERATKRGYKDGRPAKYRAFPPGNNRIDAEQAFENEEELAQFLFTHRTWKSYFRRTVFKDRKEVFESAQHLTELRT